MASPGGRCLDGSRFAVPRGGDRRLAARGNFSGSPCSPLCSFPTSLFTATVRVPSTLCCSCSGRWGAHLVVLPVAESRVTVPVGLVRMATKELARGRRRGGCVNGRRGWLAVVVAGPVRVLTAAASIVPSPSLGLDASRRSFTLVPAVLFWKSRYRLAFLAAALVAVALRVVPRVHSFWPALAAVGEIVPRNRQVTRPRAARSLARAQLEPLSLWMRLAARRPAAYSRGNVIGATASLETARRRRALRPAARLYLGPGGPHLSNPGLSAGDLARHGIRPDAARFCWPHAPWPGRCPPPPSSRRLASHCAALIRE